MTDSTNPQTSTQHVLEDKYLAVFLALVPRTHRKCENYLNCLGQRFFAFGATTCDRLIFASFKFGDHKPEHCGDLVLMPAALSSAFWEPLGGLESRCLLKCQFAHQLCWSVDAEGQLRGWRPDASLHASGAEHEPPFSIHQPAQLAWELASGLQSLSWLSAFTVQWSCHFLHNLSPPTLSCH